MTADTLNDDESGISEPTPEGPRHAPVMTPPPPPSDAPQPLAAHLASQPFVAPAPPALRSDDGVTAPATSAAPPTSAVPTPPSQAPALPAPAAQSAGDRTAPIPNPPPPTTESGPSPAPAITLPGDAAAPTVTAPIPNPPPLPLAPPAVDAPTFASPAAAAPDLPAPVPVDGSAEAATAPPVASAIAAPALPAPALAAPSTAGPGPVGGPPPAGDSTAVPPPRRRRWLTTVLGLGLVLALAAAGWFGYQHFTADAGDNADAAADPAPEGADQSDSVFDETQQLVDDINSRPELDEALGSLGLDATGEPLDPTSAADDPPADQPAGAPADPAGGDDQSADGTPADGATVPQDVASYAFRWSDPLGLSVTVQVDSATGNYVATTGDGTEIRRVGDRYFGLAANSSWVELSPDVVSGIPVIGIDGVLDDSAILPPGLEQFVVATEVTTDGVVRLLVDDASLARADTALRDQWLGPWGLLDSATPAASAFGDGVPPVATEGQVVLSIAYTTDGWISEVTVSSPAIGGTASYSLASTALSPLQIDVPAELSGG